MSSETFVIVAAAVVALTLTIVIPIFVTRKRLKNEWKRYDDSKRRFEEMQAAGEIDPETGLPIMPVESSTKESAEEGSSNG